MKAIKNFHLDNVATDIRRNLTSINAIGKYLIPFLYYFQKSYI